MQFPDLEPGVAAEMSNRVDEGGIESMNPSGLSSPAVELLQGLLHHDESARLGVSCVGIGSSGSEPMAGIHPLEILQSCLFFSANEASRQSIWGNGWVKLAQGLVVPPPLPIRVQVTGLEILQHGCIHLEVHASTVSTTWQVEVGSQEFASVLQMVASKRVVETGLQALGVPVSSIVVPEGGVKSSEFLRSVQVVCHVVQSQHGCEVQVSRLFQLLEVPAHCMQTVNLQTGGSAMQDGEWEWLREF